MLKIPFFQRIGQSFSMSYQRFKYFPFIFALVLIEVYFWINGGAHFENWSDTYGQTILYYLGMTVIFLFWSGRGTQEQMATPIKLALPVFVLSFIGTYVILFFLSMGNIIQPSELDPSLFWQMVILQVCVVATSEELMFRGVLLELTGVWVSSIAFALWHGFAYGIRYYDFSISGAVILAFVFAFIIGLLLALVAKDKRFGLPATIAIHASYNLFIVGAFFAFPKI